MPKTLTQFLERSYAKQIDEETIQVIAETAQEQDLTEEETDELIAELFGIGDTVKRIGGKITHPFKVVHAGIAGAIDRVKAKSRSMDQSAAKKLQTQKAKQTKQKNAVYAKTSGGLTRPTGKKSSGKPTAPVAKPKPIAARPTKTTRPIK
jgi:hypothetical protein